MALMLKVMHISGQNHLLHRALLPYLKEAIVSPFLDESLKNLNGNWGGIIESHGNIYTWI